MDNSKLTRGVAGCWLGLSLVLALQACTTSTDNVFSDAAPKSGELTTSPETAAISQPRHVSPGTNPNAAGRIKNTQNALTNYCPVLRIRSGTESLRKYKKGSDKENPDNVQYLARIEHVARECKYVGQNLEIAIGARGRIITGPAGKSGPVKLPIRVAIQQGGCSRHFTLHQQTAEIPSGSAHGSFRFVDDKIVIPAPKALNVRMFIGFDEGPYNKPSAKACT